MKLVAAAALLMSLSMAASEHESLDQLQARAARAGGSEQVRLYLEVAARQLQAADEAFNAGEVEQGNALVNQLSAACEKAGAAARSSGKHQKQAEIHMRNLQRRLEAMRRNLSYDDRDALSQAIDRIEKLRAELLAQMFGLKS